jgi:hypothetical protein
MVNYKVAAVVVAAAVVAVVVAAAVMAQHKISELLNFIRSFAGLVTICQIRSKGNYIATD